MLIFLPFAAGTLAIAIAICTYIVLSIRRMLAASDAEIVAFHRPAIRDDEHTFIPGG